LTLTAPFNARRWDRKFQVHLAFTISSIPIRALEFKWSAKAGVKKILLVIYRYNSTRTNCVIFVCVYATVKQIIGTIIYVYYTVFNFQSQWYILSCSSSFKIWSCKPTTTEFTRSSCFRV
jgi:hypothetical protein